MIPGQFCACEYLNGRIIFPCYIRNNEADYTETLFQVESKDFCH